MQRRLTTFDETDLVGHSRLMAADKEDTVARLRAMRQRHDITLKHWQDAFSFPTSPEVYARNAAACETLVGLGLPGE